MGKIYEALTPIYYLFIIYVTRLMFYGYNPWSFPRLALVFEQSTPNVIILSILSISSNDFALGLPKDLIPMEMYSLLIHSISFSKLALHLLTLYSTSVQIRQCHNIIRRDLFRECYHASMMVIDLFCQFVSFWIS